jgi:hypothetical protein
MSDGVNPMKRNRRSDSLLSMARPVRLMALQKKTYFFYIFFDDKNEKLDDVLNQYSVTFTDK